MKCKIQWIDENGRPTPDENEATVLIRMKAHDPVMADGRTVHIDESEWYPCCASHYAQLENDPKISAIWESKSIL